MPSSLPPLSLNAWLRYDVVERLLRVVPEIRSLVEVGCGQGSMGARLAVRLDDYLAFEPDVDSFRIARRRLEDAGTGEVRNSVLPGDPLRSFDALAAFEVLEHLEDDLGALRRWREWIRPDGCLLLSVPAHQRRFGRSDVAVGHYRRYDRAGLVELLQRADFEVEEVSAYGFPLGYVLELARNRLAPEPAKGSRAERTAASGRLHQPGEAMAPVTRVVTFPFRLLQRPFLGTELGTGWVTLARRRG